MVHPALVTTLLGRTDLFGGLAEADRRAVAEEMREANFRPDEQVFVRGDLGNRIYLVVEGRVRLSVLSADGRVLSFKHASVGDIFGEIATLDGGVRTADATALTAVCAMTLARAPFLRLLETKPQAAQAALAFVCARLRATSAQIEAIALHSIEVRLARFLLSAIDISKTPAVAGRVRLDLGISQTEMAQLLGASRQKVNGALAALEDAGAVQRIDGRRLECIVDALERAAQPD